MTTEEIQGQMKQLQELLEKQKVLEGDPGNLILNSENVKAEPTVKEAMIAVKAVATSLVDLEGSMKKLVGWDRSSMENEIAKLKRRVTALESGFMTAEIVPGSSETPAS